MSSDKALYDTTDTRQYQAYVVTDMPAPPAAPGPPQVERPGGRERNRAPHGVPCFGLQV